MNMKDTISLLESHIVKLRTFISETDGHSEGCGVNREGFEGCNEAMFYCDCEFEDEKRRILAETQ